MINWQYYLLRTLSGIVCLLPYSAVLALGKLVGHLYYRFVSRQRERAIKQIQEGLGLSREQAKPIIRSMCCKIGQSFLEILYIPHLNPERIKKLVSIENRQYMADALSQGKGIVVWTAHMGNWEWMAAYLAMDGFPVTTIYTRQKNMAYTQILNDFRKLMGVEVFASSSTELVGAARALKQGKLLGFLADMDAGREGIFTDFFNKPASTPPGPALFAKRFQSPVVPAFIVRRPGGGHRIIIHPPLYCEDAGNKEEEFYNLTVKLNKITENIIREHPDEWLWFKKRWKTKLEK